MTITAAGYKGGSGMTEEFVALRDMTEWDEFASANAEALTEIGPTETCLALACNCELLVGGGAGLLYRIGFVDEE